MSWPTVELGDAVTFKGGGTPSRDESSFWGGPIPWATVKDLNSGYALRETQEFITEEGLRRSASNLIPAGTVVIPTRMALGKAVVSEVDIAINQDLKAVFPVRELDSRFLLWFFIANSSRIEAMGKGATVKGVTLDQLRSLEIRLPPISEQRRIAAILDKADALRAKRREAIAKLDQLLQSVFLDMFGDPVTNPNSWPIREFSQVADFITGYPFKSKQFLGPGEGVKLCRGTNVLPSSLDWTEEANWNATEIDGFERYRLLPGDVVVAMDRPWISTGFKIHLFSDDDPECLLVQRVARLRPRAHFKPNFLYALFSSDSFRRHCKPTETTVPHISPKDFRSFPVLDPGKLEIDRYEQIAISVRSLGKSLSLGLCAVENLFGSLQRKAFVGAI